MSAAGVIPCLVRVCATLLHQARARPASHLEAEGCDEGCVLYLATKVRTKQTFQKFLDTCRQHRLLVRQLEIPTGPVRFLFLEPCPDLVLHSICVDSGGA